MDGCCVLTEFLRIYPASGRAGAASSYTEDVYSVLIDPFRPSNVPLSLPSLFLSLSLLNVGWFSRLSWCPDLSYRAPSTDDACPPGSDPGQNGDVRLCEHPVSLFDH